MSTVKTYYTLTKPGIIYGNVITAAAGFLLAAKGHVDFRLLLATLAGTSLVIASACVFNNYLDRGLDAKMARTKRRALVKGTVSGPAALTYAAALGLTGFLILGFRVNLLVVTIGLIAFIDYVVLYGVSKRRSVHGTLVGSIAGAAPIVSGYCAVTNRFDGGAFILFMILVLWQMPHFYAIATHRFDDYRMAGLPVLPIKHGMKNTKLQILLYISAFIVANIMLSAFGYTGYTYLIIMILLGLAWLRKGAQGLRANDDKLWAHQMFLFSLLIILSLSVILAASSLLP